MAPSKLDLRDIQGNILRAYGNDYRHTAYVFVHIDHAARGRDWLRGLVGRVTTAQPWSAGKPETTLNVAFTYLGLTAVGVHAAMLATFSQEFRDGMAARARLLGDTGDSDPRQWDAGLGDGHAHVLVTINALTAAHLERRLDELRGGIAGTAAGTILYEQRAELLPGVREHFGFADGFAQPAIEGSSDHRQAGGGAIGKDGHWRSLAAGEFILGYQDEDTRHDPQGRLPSAPDSPLGINGTYAVWRKLHQDVALFRRTLRDAAQLYHDGDEEKLAAKVVGRWRNGTPLVKSPDGPQHDFSPQAPGANDFHYAGEDPSGLRCPLGAHIRRSNPRDALGFGSQLTLRHRIIRRGMPYGPALPASATEDDGAERGLVFMCFNASLSRQFEGVQLQWLNDGNIFHLGHDKDFINGDAAGTGKMTIQGTPPFLLAPQPSFVTTRGGEYLFVPGLAALTALADGLAG